VEQSVVQRGNKYQFVLRAHSGKKKSVWCRAIKVYQKQPLAATFSFIVVQEGLA
jgi:hypothetical protein